MPVSKITKTNYGREAIKYAQEGRGHDGSKQRNAETGCVNLAMGVDFADQMEPVWNRAIRRHKCQILRVIQSFALDECDPENPEDIHKANMIGQYFARTFYPRRQAVVFTQIDGAGGKVHNHILISDVHMETYKGHTAEQSLYSNVERWTRESAAKYLDRVRNPREENQNTPDKVTRTERTKREKGEYIWKDTLKERIRKAMDAASDEADFYAQLKKRGVTAEKRESEKYGTYFTYKLDRKYVPKGEKVPKNLSARSYKMGSVYGHDALVYTLGVNRDRTVKDTEAPPASSGGKARERDEKKQDPEQPKEEKEKSEEEIRHERLDRWLRYMEHDNISQTDELGW